MKPLFLSVLLVSACASAPPSQPPPKAQPAPIEDVALCTGAADSALGVTVLPDRVTAASKGEPFTLRLELTSRFAKRASVRHAFELVDDRGNAIAPKRIAPIQTLAPGAIAAHRFELPALADGFYTARVTAVGKGGGEAAAEIVSAHLEVVDGTILPIDLDEWHVRSRANQGVFQ